MDYRVVFGGLLATILAALYVSLTGQILYQVNECSADPSCTTVATGENVAHLLTTIGGLISALVVARLALTEPKKNPGTFATLNGRSQTLAQVLVWLYLVVWLGVGLIALVVGNILQPQTSQTLSDIGSAWFGLAIASGYVYFQLTPPSGG